jgi:hypothetical protein
MEKVENVKCTNLVCTDCDIQTTVCHPSRINCMNKNTIIMGNCNLVGGLRKIRFVYTRHLSAV